MQTLTFQNITLTPAKVDNQIWLTSAELAKALDYSRSDEVNNLYNRKKDEFTANMTQTAEIQTKGGLQRVRIFSLRGCHLIAMFSRTKVAKEFRQWVLDILDKEVGEPVQVKPKLSSEDTLPLRNAVNMATEVLKLDHSTIYRMVHQKFGVNNIRELTQEQLTQAIQYIHELILASRTTAPFASDELTDHQMNAIRQMIEVIQGMFAMKGSAHHAIWARLRKVTGVKSPSRFCQHHLPILGRELKRIYHAAEQHSRARAMLEDLVIKQVIRYGDGEKQDCFEEFALEMAVDEDAAKHLKIPYAYERALERIATLKPHQPTNIFAWF